MSLGLYKGPFGLPPSSPTLTITMLEEGRPCIIIGQLSWLALDLSSEDNTSVVGYLISKEDNQKVRSPATPSLHLIPITLHSGSQPGEQKAPGRSRTSPTGNSSASQAIPESTSTSSEPTPRRSGKFALKSTIQILLGTTELSTLDLSVFCSRLDSQHLYSKLPAER